MKPQNNSIKWLIGVLAGFLFFSFAITLPTVSAQGEVLPTFANTPTVNPTVEMQENLPTVTPTPTEPIPYFPTFTPTPEAAESQSVLQQEEQPLAPLEDQQQAATSSSNISSI